MTWRVWVQTSPSGMPLRVLGAVDQGFELREVAHPSGDAQELEPARDLPALEQELAPLVEDALGRQAFERDRPAQLDGLGRRVELEARHQLHAAQHAQRILDEALGGVAQQPPLEVAAAAERVLELAGREVDRASR